MAANPYGTDVRCVFDADALWTATTGLQAVEQDLIHRLLTNNVLGPGGDGWGYDVRQLLGMPARELAGKQPMLVEVLTRDERVQTADVTLTVTTTNGLSDVTLDVTCVLFTGKVFRYVKSIRDLAAGDIEAQA